MSLPFSWTIPTGFLLQFVLEGDNRTDAGVLAIATAKALGVDELIREWRQPNSWQQGLFGAPHDQTIYG